MASTVENVTTLIGLILYLIVVYYVVKSVGSFVDEIRFNRAKKSFFGKLQNKMRYGIIKNLADVTLIQDSIAKNRKFHPFASRDIDSLLVEYLDHLSDRDKKSFRLVKSLIIQARAEKLLYILPENERMKARELREQIKNKDEVLSKNFEDLVVSLGMKLQAANKEIKSKRLNYISIIISVITGVVGILIYLSR